MQARGTTALLLATLAVTLALAPAALTQGEEKLTAPQEVTINVYLGPGQDAPFTITPKQINVAPDANVTLRVINVGGTDHDLSLLAQDFGFDEEDLAPREDNGQDAVKTPLLGPGEEYNLTVQFGSDYSGSIAYICSVAGHRSNGMEGTLTVGAAAAEGGEEEIVDFGVDYLAYWVGIVSFVILFIVLFGTFFLFRYGESKNVVDHRTGGPQTITVAAGDTETEGREMVQPMVPSPGQVAKVLAVLTLIGLAFYFLM